MRKTLYIALSCCCLLFAGCLGKPLLPFALETPPLTLIPASAANIEDGRGRFREIYCAVQKDHGSTLPYDRPCEEVILRLEGEPNPTSRPVSLGQAKLKLGFSLFPGCTMTVSKPARPFLMPARMLSGMDTGHRISL